MKESVIQNKIIKYLNRIGAYSIKTISTNRSGCPDLICCLNGKFIGLEVKNEDGVTSALQDHHLELIRKSGGVSAAVRSVDEVKQLLKNFPRENK